MRVDEVMSSATCCGPDDTVEHCARVMKEENIGFVPVCDDQRRTLGAITDRDIAIRVVAEGKSSSESVRGFMTRGAVSCRVGDDVAAAEQLMRDQQVSRVMVCDTAGRLQGVISLQDLAVAESEDSTGRTLTEVKSDQPSVH